MSTTGARRDLRRAEDAREEVSDASDDEAIDLESLSSTPLRFRGDTRDKRGNRPGLLGPGLRDAGEGSGLDVWETAPFAAVDSVRFRFRVDRRRVAVSDWEAEDVGVEAPSSSSPTSEADASGASINTGTSAMFNQGISPSEDPALGIARGSSFGVAPASL